MSTGMRKWMEKDCPEIEYLPAQVLIDREELDRLEAAEKERDALRTKVEAMERQAPFDADSDVFRSAFEAALKAGNWPATRQGDGYRSPSTQIAWRIAFSTVNRLKLYLAPGAQPAPSVPDSIIADAARYQFLRNGGAYLEPHEGEIYMATDYGAKYYKDLRDLDMDIDEAIAAAPEAKP